MLSFTTLLQAAPPAIFSPAIPNIDPAVEPYVPEKAFKHVLKGALVGSRVTCDPPPIGTDQDVLILATSKRFHYILREDGWGMSPGQREYQARTGRDKVYFWSYRKHDVNIIRTDNEPFYEKFLLGTYVAKKLNILHKPDRQTLFQALVYGNRS